MLDFMTENILASSTTTGITISAFLLCVATGLGIGFLLALTYRRKSKSSPGFLVTLALLPAVVAMIILMVNGNIGAGVAVAGTFSLVRFRSVPGTAKEICAIFIAMAAGLAVGMGYLILAVLFTVILALAEMFYNTKKMQSFYGATQERQLRITIPEDLDYAEIFDDIFAKYLKSNELVEVKTTNMGSLFRLTYRVVVKDNVSEKKMMDAIRVRNGNLEISFSRALNQNEL